MFFADARHVSGHDFSRAEQPSGCVKEFKKANRALAPAAVSICQMLSSQTLEPTMTISEERSSMQEIRIGIVGYGTVGRASAEILTSHAEEIRSRTGGLSIRVARICRRTPGAAENGVNGIPVVSDWREVVSASDVDIVVEAIGGTSVAYDVIRASLEQGKAVVTANKALIAPHGEELFALARRKNLPVGIEASVAGGVPVIRAISEAPAAERIKAVYGIL